MHTYTLTVETHTNTHKNTLHLFEHFNTSPLAIIDIAVLVLKSWNDLVPPVDTFINMTSVGELMVAKWDQKVNGNRLHAGSTKVAPKWAKGNF